MQKIGFYLVLIAILAVSCKVPKVATEKVAVVHSEEQTQPTPPALPVKRTKADAIAAGLDFLVKSRWEWDLVYLYSYLQPKFGWPTLPSQSQNKQMADSLRRVGDPPALRILDQMALFQRLVDPGFQLTRERMQSAEEEDRFTLIALYCDGLKPDTATLFPTLRQEMEAGDYRLTHALLTCHWLTERACFSNESLRDIRKQLITKTFALMERIPEWIDLRIEAAALLAAAGESTPGNWVDELLNEQQADGGWKKDRHQLVSTAHPTVLALWYLATVN